MVVVKHRVPDTSFLLETYDSWLDMVVSSNSFDQVLDNGSNLMQKISAYDS